MAQEELLDIGAGAVGAPVALQVTLLLTVRAFLVPGVVAVVVEPAQ